MSRPVYNSFFSHEKEYVPWKDSNKFPCLILSISVLYRVRPNSRCRTRISHFRAYYGADIIASDDYYWYKSVFFLSENIEKMSIKKKE